MMQQSPELFTAYHDGFRAQVKDWPLNPLDLMIKEVQKLPSGTVVADFGCGEARLAATVTPRIKVHSFDLVAPPGNKYITPCDCANVPLPDSSVDIAIFCLSLMGTNYEDFLSEATRVLKPGGRLFISEVRSRFEGADAKDENVGRKRVRSKEASKPMGSAGVTEFIDAMISAGYSLLKRDETNKMFVVVHFQKGINSKDDETALTIPNLRKKNDTSVNSDKRKAKRTKAYAKKQIPSEVTNKKDKTQNIAIRAPALKACIYKRR